MAEYTLINCPIFWDHLSNLAPAAAASVIYIQSTKIKSATQKIRAADNVEEKLDAVADALDRMNTKSNALAAMTYFLTKRK
jgi:hypothetical protein